VKIFETFELPPPRCHVFGNKSTKNSLLGIHYCECKAPIATPQTGSTQQVKPGIYWGKNVVDGGVDTGGVGTLNRCW